MCTSSKAENNHQKIPMRAVMITIACPCSCTRFVAFYGAIIGATGFYMGIVKGPCDEVCRVLLGLEGL